MDIHRIEIPFAFDEMAGHSAEHLNTIAAELMKLDRVSGGGVLFDNDRRHAALVIEIEGADHVDAMHRGLAAARTAIHAAGGATPGWERMVSRILAELEC